MKSHAMTHGLFFLALLFSMLCLTAPALTSTLSAATGMTTGISLPGTPGLMAEATATPAFELSTLQPQGTFQIFLPIICKRPDKYYVDSVNGSDSNPGTSEARPWKTLSPVHAYFFQPGDTIYFKRGSRWTGGLVINDSGEEGRPITFKAYGEGDRPIFENPGGHVITIDADWIVLEDVLVRNGRYGGVLIKDNSEHNIVRNIEVTNVSTGIWVSGPNNLITHNYIHDLAKPPTDIARGIGVYNRNLEISYNTLTRIPMAANPDGNRTDGNPFELFAYIDNAYIHHNYVYDTAGFAEVGANWGNGSARNVTFAYNLSVNNHKRFQTIHTAGRWATHIANYRVENNTIVEIRERAPWKFAVMGFPDAPPPSNEFILRNNIFYVDYVWQVADIRTSAFIHDHNLYDLLDHTDHRVGFDLGTGELVADPLFVHVPGNDFHLQAGSPARDAGVNLGYSLDFENKPVPAGGAPDMGAFEYTE